MRGAPRSGAMLLIDETLQVRGILLHILIGRIGASLLLSGLNSFFIHGGIFLRIDGINHGSFL